MVRWRLAITLFLILAVAVAGCVGNGDIGTAIDKWNKVADKTKEIRSLEEQYVKAAEIDNVIIEAELAKDSPDFKKILPLLDKEQKILDDERKLLEEKSSLISEFAGATVNLNKEAKIYGNSALSNIREEHRYWTSSVHDSDRAI